MAITSIDNKKIVAADGLTEEFDFNFVTNDPSHIKVYLNTLRNELVTGFVVQLNPDQQDIAGGKVVFSAPYPEGELIIVRVVPNLQETVFQRFGAFPAKTVEFTFDDLVMMIQQLQEQADRSIKVDVTEVPEFDYIFPVYEPNHILVWDPIEPNRFINFDLAVILQAQSSAEAAAQSAEAAAQSAAEALILRNQTGQLRDDTQQIKNDAESAAASVDANNIVHTEGSGLPNALQAPVTDYYNRSNILGTVSQSSGLPTGAIIQRGSNANGEFVRFADGTMICRHSFPITGTTNSTSITGVFRSDGTTWSFPSGFVDGNISVLDGVGRIVSDSVEAWGAVRERGSATAVIRVYSSTSGSSTVMTASPIAIGRWY